MLQPLDQLLNVLVTSGIVLVLGLDVVEDTKALECGVELGDEDPNEVENGELLEVEDHRLLSNAIACGNGRREVRLELSGIGKVVQRAPVLAASLLGWRLLDLDFGNRARKSFFERRLGDSSLSRASEDPLAFGATTLLLLCASGGVLETGTRGQGRRHYQLHRNTIRDDRSLPGSINETYSLIGM